MFADKERMPSNGDSNDEKETTLSVPPSVVKSLQSWDPGLVTEGLIYERDMGGDPNPNPNPNRNPKR